MEKIVISCMDRRLNSYIEQKYGNAIVLRNAGANVRPLEPLINKIIEENNIGEIIALPHTDCGAMGKVYSVLKQKMDADPDLVDSLVSEYSPDFSTREELEKKNYEMQLERLRTDYPSLKVSGHYIDMKEISVPPEEKEHKLLVITPSKPNYSKIFASLKLDPFQCYVIQANTEFAMPDIKLAVSDLHVKTIYFVTQSGEDPRISKKEADRAMLSLSGYKSIEIIRYDARS